MPRYGIEFELFINAPNAQQAYRRLVENLNNMGNRNHADGYADEQIDYESCPRSEHGYATNEETGEEEEFDYA